VDSRAYEKGKKMLHSNGMAVLVQQCVASEASGIIFTMNPISGDDEIIIEAVKGLGDKLASGEIIPDKWVVRGSDVVPNSITQHAIDRDQALYLATLAKEVVEYFRSPQDIEWSISKGKTYVLQARPITAICQHHQDNGEPNQMGISNPPN
jgi:pyruvate,water dikinase